MNYIEDVSGGVFAYDQRIFGEDWDKNEDPVINYFSDTNPYVSTIYEAIHVSDSTKVPVFEMSSSAVNEAFNGDKMIDYSHYIVDLINLESPVLIYAGEFDAQDGPKTIEPWLRKLEIPNYDEFWGQSRNIYWV